MKKLEMLRPERRPIAHPSTSQHLVKARLRPAYSSGASIYPNKQWRAGMRENGERKRAVEDNPHGFRHRFGRATRRHNKDGICRAFRPVGVELEHGVLNDSAHHSIRFGNIPEIGSWQKRFLDSQSTKHAPRSRSSERSSNCGTKSSMPPLGRVVPMRM